MAPSVVTHTFSSERSRRIVSAEDRGRSTSIPGVVTKLVDTMKKMTNWKIKTETFEAFATQYKIPLLPPELATYLATTVEHVTPVLMVLGLATRVAGAAMMGVIVIIFVFVHQDEWPAFLIWTSAIAYLGTKGPGALSLDHLIRGWLLPKR